MDKIVINSYKNLPHERCNFITNKIMIGACPIVETLKKMEDYGIDIFIDLRSDTNYNTKKQKYHFPMMPGKPPSIKQANDILEIVLKNPDKLIYIHCNGGNGRAGTIGAYLIGKMYNMDTYEAVSHIEKQRNTRIDKSRNFIPTPEMPLQIKFLVKHLGLKKNNNAPNRSDKSWLHLL